MDILLQETLGVKREPSTLVRCVKRQRVIKNEVATSAAPVFPSEPMLIDSDTEAMPNQRNAVKTETKTETAKMEPRAGEPHRPKGPTEILDILDSESDGENVQMGNVGDHGMDMGDMGDQMVCQGMTPDPPAEPSSEAESGEERAGAAEEQIVQDDAPLDQAAIPQDRILLLKIQKSWCDKLLAGQKVWELRSQNSHVRGRVALGYNFQIFGFIDILDVKVVGVRKGNTYNGKPDNAEDFWLAPHNLQKHGATAETLRKLKWKGPLVHAYVMANPWPLDVPLSYAKERGPVSWSSVPASILSDVARAKTAEPVRAGLKPVVALSLGLTDLVLSGKTKWIPSKAAVAETVVLHVYNVKWARIEGTVKVRKCLEYASPEEALRDIRSKGVQCVPVPQQHGVLWLLELEDPQAWPQPIAALPGLPGARNLRLMEADVHAMMDARPRQPLQATQLRGAAPTASLRSTCAHFLDRLCAADLVKLQANLHILDGVTIRVAGTCSGCESSIPVWEHTLNALNARFGVNVQVEHVLSCDNDPTRQQFILEAHASKLGMLVSDCQEFDNGPLTCVKSNTRRPCPKTDVLIAGPSCVNVSGMRIDGARFVGCLEEGHEEYAACESSVTYKQGVLKAAEQMEAAIVLYENVPRVLHHCKDDAGEVHEPAIKTVEADLTRLGYHVQYRSLNTQDFALPQRRNRAWLMASKGPLSEIGAVEATFVDMSSAVHVGNIFQQGLPKGVLSSKGQKQVEALLDQFRAERSDYKDLFLAPNTSSGRGTEHNVGATTCLRPTSQVWSESLGRYLSGMEHLMCQGIFAQDFAEPSAVERLAQRRTAAMSFAGKGFSTTVLQANVLALLIHSSSWELIRDRHVQRGQQQQQHQEESPCRLHTPARAPGEVEPETISSSSHGHAPVTETPPSSSTATKSRSSRRKRKFLEYAAGHGDDDGDDPVRRGLFRTKKSRRGQNNKGKTLDVATKQRYLEEYDKRKRDGVKHPEKSMLAEKGRFPGIFSGCFAKWGKLSTKQKWARVCSNMPGAAKKARQLPRWVLASVQCGDKGSGRSPGKLPERVLRIAEDVLLQQLQLGAEITVPAVANLLGTCIEVWNEEVGKLQAANAASQDAASRTEHALCTLSLSKTPASLYKHAGKFLRKFDFSVHKIAKPGKHLRADAPQVMAVKEYIFSVLRDGHAHPLLVGNFDQVWTCMYEPAARAIWKDPKRQGQLRCADRKPGRFYQRAQLAKQLRVDLGLESAALAGPLGDRHKEEDGYSQIGCIANWRIPRTTTTLSWRNGDLGRLFITVADAKISDAQLEEAQSLRGYAHVERSQSSTHMWRGETTVRYLAFLKTELANRRKQYNLRWEDGALIVADDASVHSDQRFRELRKLWEQENNCMLLGCDKQHPVQIPGGFGAAGAPNDQWHQTWRLLRRAWLRKAVGSGNPAYGRTLEEAQFDLRGEICTTCPWMTSLQADVYALQALRNHRHGNIIMSAWHRLGYIDLSELARLNFAGDEVAAEAAMEQARGSMATLINLDVLPHLNLEEAARELDAQQLATALHGKKHVWWHHDSDERCAPLPQWLNPALELSMQARVKEHQKWQEEIASRGNKGLTAKATTRYEQWKANPTRAIVVDLKREQGLGNGARPNKFCRAIHVRMAMNPEDLGIQVGDTVRTLFVRQYLDGEQFPATPQVDPAILHVLQGDACDAAEEEEDDEADWGQPLEEMEHAAGEPLGRAAPQEVAEAQEVEWDCVWVAGGNRERCLVHGVEKRYDHGSGEYQRLLPPREGRVAVPRKGRRLPRRHALCSGARIQRYAPPDMTVRSKCGTRRILGTDTNLGSKSKGKPRLVGVGAGNQGQHGRHG